MTELTVNLTSWGDRWALAGISVLTVFVILIILVAILQVFSAIAKRGGFSSKHPEGHPEGVDLLADAPHAEKAAVATALYLYMNDQHDVESGILTINPETDSVSPWQALSDQNPL